MGTCFSEIPEPDHQNRAQFELEYRRSVFQWATEQLRDDVQESTCDAFRLTAIDGQSPAEGARQLGVSIASVYTAKCRVMARIRSTIEAFEAEDRGESI